MSADATADLLRRAHDSRIIVIGGGIAGLVAAWDCAKVGLRVSVLEAADEAGGAIRTRVVAGVPLDVGAESYATRGGHVRALLSELGLDGEIVRPRGGRAWLAGVPRVGAAPLPAGGLLGIPENPFADDVRRVIGWRGAWRAYVDRLRPVLTIGHQHSLGTLVSSRMGARVLERLVAPVVQGVYSARPEEIDVDAAAPGLNAALTRVGTLSGAVVAMRGDRDPKLAPGAAVEGLRGGMGRLVDALVERIRELGGEVVTGAPVRSIARGEDDWVVRREADDAAERRGDAVATPAEALEDVRGDAVIVATGEEAARRLLSPLVPALPTDAGVHPVVEVVTLVVDAPALDAAPRGSGVLTVPGSHVAKALTHVTAKWQWVADAFGESGRHVVRVSFGAQGEAPATAALSDDDAFDLAREQASVLLGVSLPADAVVDAHRASYAQSQPASAIGLAESAARARASVADAGTMAVVGAWLAGTGLANVVPDALAGAERIRTEVLWR
ncbi:FAD-dependent oxidoreductase [Microbacterium sp. LRZ72]|uniref:protoporphyrinogen/coproporphyrinogen oxidase n=1 Tax=Microbacterium sp. LRZ72 TaxID=2942481 RepID=UPI0029BB81BC|nr:FAD-dependent oxidoreductase [Microbacterium sp. LRZ72]MDX2376410.1 FAD-dependent oxidoreductase [Microbacterium sp. LRZ72]